MAPGRSRRGLFTPAARATDITITTFAIATRDTEALRTVDWRHVVVDEAQHIKNVSTAASRAVRSIEARQRIALTGTPVENRLEDLRAVVDLVNPGLLGSPSVFKARFAEAIERERDPEAARRLTAIHLTVHPAAGQVGSHDHRRPAGEDRADRPRQPHRRAGGALSGGDRRSHAIPGTSGVRRDPRGASCPHGPRRTDPTQTGLHHPAHFLGDGSSLVRRNVHRSGKLELLADILENIVADGERALIFTQFTAFGDMVAPWLSQICGDDVSFLHGGLSRSVRDRMVSEFQTTPVPRS